MKAGPDIGGTTAFLLAILLWNGGVSDRNGHGEETSEPPPKTDRWAGKSVKSAEHVQGMLGDRLHNAPKEGTKAPPLQLRDARTDQVRRLSDLHRQKPVVLFFGSRSCSVTQKSSEAVTGLWRQFGDRADFYLVYIREAHPAGGDDFASGSRFAAPDATTEEERAAAALEFAREKNIEFSVLVDRMDDSAAVRWGGWPVRLFLIDRSGTLRFAGQQGPWFQRPTVEFKPGLTNVPEEIRDLPGYSRGSLEEALVDLFSKKSDAKPSQRRDSGVIKR